MSNVPKQAELPTLHIPQQTRMTAADDLISSIRGKFGTILADPPWRFQNSTGKVAPEHKRLARYGTLSLPEIKELPVAMCAAEVAHLYLWVPNALLPEGLEVMKAWGFNYKSNIVWYKIRKDGGPDGRGVGFYFRNVTEVILFGTRGKHARTLAPGRRQVNVISKRKREHSRKPDEVYPIIEACSRGPFLELFARTRRQGWTVWGKSSARGYGGFCRPHIRQRIRAQSGVGATNSMDWCNRYFSLPVFGLYHGGFHIGARLFTLPGLLLLR